MSASPAVRSLRAAVFAAVCVLLAAAGHGLAMGDLPPLWADAAGFAAVFALGRALAGRERGLPEIGAGMLLTQAGLHFGFDAARAVTPGPVHAMNMTSMRMHGHAATGVARMAGMTGMAQRHPHVHILTAHATVAHVVAALVASWWLRRGEAALWSLLRRTAAFVPGLAAWYAWYAWWRKAPLSAPADGARRAPARPIRPRRLLALRHAVSRRGPPNPIPYTV
ncbi:hypothetical protein [Streptomyces fuscichromogenes]|uniref:Integral membrane protein n=1 Tax=Streptomyces fuscichromogenes TaxID=1324013 RepID=A0A917XHT9_9ACTN|nr:hypothetical protein [Streptomyces fuscichromogenes]GGN27714.1 hypothetical protein GCM10011578_063200 [Streptomyces fuscichromogenes]